LETEVTYCLQSNGVEVALRTTTDREIASTAPMGWLAFMFASYIRPGPESDRHIRFMGGDVSCRECGVTRVSHGISQRIDAAPLDFEDGTFISNIVTLSTFWVLPFTYIVIQPAPEQDEMLYAMLFEPGDEVRFAVFDWWKANGESLETAPLAVDWQWIVRNPEPLTTYDFKVKIFYGPTKGRNPAHLAFKHWMSWSAIQSQLKEQRGRPNAPGAR